MLFAREVRALKGLARYLKDYCVQLSTPSAKSKKELEKARQSVREMHTFLRLAYTNLPGLTSLALRETEVERLISFNGDPASYSPIKAIQALKEVESIINKEEDVQI